MFTKEDYENYFNQVAHVERKMIYGVYDLAREIDDPPIARVLQRVGDDEVRHYGYVLKMLRLADAGRSEDKYGERGNCLGTIQLRKLSDPPGNEIQASCINLTKAGVCLEGATALSPEDVCKLMIHLFGREEAISRRGKVAWSKEIEPDFYISGIVFDQ